MIKLYDWQEPLAEEIRRILLAHDTCINGMPTGTGKTFVAVDTAVRLDLPFLVIAPKAALINWQRVAGSMGGSHLLRGVINPERISLGRCQWYDGNKWNLDGVGMVVWDEIHKGASGVESKATLAAARLKRMPVKKLLMSATIADSPLKMRALGYLLGLHDFSKAGFCRWAEGHGCFWNKNLPRAVFQFTKGKKAAAQHMADIHAAIAGQLVYKKISEIPGFPETLVESKLYDLDKGYADMVKAAYEDMEERMKKPGRSMLVELLRARERSEYCKASLLADLTEDLLEEGRSVVVFCNFRSALRRVGELLVTKGIVRISTIHGDQSPGERQAHIDQFQNNDTHVMLAMIQAGGISVSLHDVKQERPRASLLTPGFNAAETVQALGRIHRAGGTPTTQQFVLAAGTIEESVHERVSAKLQNIDRLNDGDLGL